MGMQSGRHRRRSTKTNSYYKHLLLQLLQKIDGLVIETYLRCTLRIIIVNLSSYRSRRMLLRLRSQLECVDYYTNNQLKRLIRQLIMLKTDQDIYNVIGKGQFSQFSSQRQMRNLDIYDTRTVDIDRYVPETLSPQIDGPPLIVYDQEQEQESSQQPILIWAETSPQIIDVNRQFEGETGFELPSLYHIDQQNSMRVFQLEISFSSPDRS